MIGIFPLTFVTESSFVDFSTKSIAKHSEICLCSCRWNQKNQMHQMNQMHQFLEPIGRERQGKRNMVDGVSSKAIRKSVSLPAELWDAIVDIQHARRVRSQTSSLELVVRAGLRVMLRECEAKANRKQRTLS